MEERCGKCFLIPELHGGGWKNVEGHLRCKECLGRDGTEEFHIQFENEKVKAMKLEDFKDEPPKIGKCSDCGAREKLYTDRKKCWSCIAKGASAVGIQGDNCYPKQTCKCRPGIVSSKGGDVT